MKNEFGEEGLGFSKILKYKVRLKSLISEVWLPKNLSAVLEKVCFDSDSYPLTFLKFPIFDNLVSRKRVVAERKPPRFGPQG